MFSVSRSLPRYQSSVLPLTQKQFYSFSGRIATQLSKFKTRLQDAQHRNRLTQLFLETVTGVEILEGAAVKEAVIKHQKLFVAYSSIHNHFAAHEHAEMAYARQLFEEKDYSVQRRYLALVEKPTELLSQSEAIELTQLYEFALNQEPNPVFQKRAEMYQTVADQIENRKSAGVLE